MHQNHEGGQMEPQEQIEAFLADLAVQIRKFEKKTGHKISTNVAVQVEETGTVQFAYCREIDMTCPGCGGLHVEGEALQPTFVNTLDIGGRLAAYPWKSEEARKSAFIDYTVDYDEKAEHGGDCFIIIDGGVEYGPGHRLTKQKESVAETHLKGLLGKLGVALSNLNLKSDPAIVKSDKPTSPQMDPQTETAIKAMVPGGYVEVPNDAENLPDPIKAVIEMLQKAGGTNIGAVKIFRQEK